MSVTDVTPATINHPVLIMIRGLPGSGKSYIANALLTELGTDRAIILDPDAIDFTSQAYADLCKTLTEEGIEEKFFPNRFLKEQGYAALDAGKNIIWNQAFTDLGGFGRSHGSLQDYATEHDIPLAMLVVEVQIDPKIAQERLAKRATEGGHVVNDEAFARFINDYHSFAGEGYTTVSVNGQDSAATSVGAIMQALQDLQ